MKTLTSLAIALVAALFLVPASASDADGDTVYEGTITGIVCSACRSHVTVALKENLEGTSDVAITPGEQPGRFKLVITSSKADVSKDSAIAALGDLKDNYQILELAKKG